MPPRRPTHRPPRTPHPRAAHGAILLESLVALTLLSLCAAGTFVAFDQLEHTVHTVRELYSEAHAQVTRIETASVR